MTTMTLEEIKFIRDTVFETVEFKKNVDIEFIDAEGITVEYDGKKARIGADSKAGFARGCFLLAMELDAGKESVSIQEKAHFNHCGMKVDCSRNAVMSVESMKKYINVLACLGFDMLVLYTEDTYEISNRPRFGYMRGRYTKDEMHELVAYGERFGIELVPNIEVLGHSEQYLKYAKTCNSAVNFDTGERINEIMNTRDTLLLDNEETYRYIEDQIRTCRELYHTNKIATSIDEAQAAFQGKYVQKHGIQPKLDVLFRHLRRVTDICEKYGFKPIVSSDTFFRCASKEGKYMDPDVVFPAELVEQIPDIEVNYWDYRAAEPAHFDRMMKKHQELKVPVNYSATLHTHSSPLVGGAAAWLNGMGAFPACLKNNINTVFTTVFGDDGTPCDYWLANPYLPIITEYYYKGEACTEADIKRASEYLTKIPFDVVEEMSDANCVVDEKNQWRMQAKRMLFGDILYDMSMDLEHCDLIMKAYSKHAKTMQQQMALKDKNYVAYRYAWLIYEVGLKKVQLRKNLQKAYLENDREYLRYIAEELLPELAKTMEQLSECHRMQWESHYKMFGFEVHCYRYGGAVARIREIAQRISRYLAGEVSRIEELEAERIPNGLSYYLVREMVTPSDIC